MSDEDSSSSSPAPVRMLGPYIVGPTLGVGGFSKVRLGVHEVTKERVALKILKKDKLQQMSSSIKRQVEREITAMQRIQHVNVIGMKTVDWDCTYVKKNGTKVPSILVVLELATGGELFEFLAFTGCFEEAVARTYFHQLIEGVGFCHSKGVAHRDLKPENLLLNDDFVLKIADFGFSNVMGGTAAERLMHTECGTPGYMAPEMFRNNSDGYDASAADVWACGVIIFIMLAGFPPIQKPNSTDWWFVKLLTGKHALFWQAHSRNAYFSEQTKDLINKILQPDPTRRITVSQIKNHPWYQGPTISHQALINELQRRKRTVDEQKNREALEKKQQRAVRSAGAGATPVQTITYRDLLEPSNGQGGLDNMFTPSFGGPSRDLEDESSQSSEEAPAPMYDGTLTCYTQFETETAPKLVLQRLEGFMNRIPNAEYGKKEHRIKATIPSASRGTLTVVAQIYATEQKTSIVQVRRMKGDSTQFRAIYALLRKELAGIIKEQKREEGDDSSLESKTTELTMDADSDELPDYGPDDTPANQQVELYGDDGDSKESKASDD